MCHGEDGKLGINGSKDLTKSLLTKEERVLVIKNGRNTMTPFAGILSDNEILAIADYTFTLK
jgi:cytochrome c6